MLEARRLDIVEPLFGLQAAGRLVTEAFAPWVQDLGLLVEAVEAGRPPGAQADWQPGRGAAAAVLARASAATAAWSVRRRLPRSPTPP